MYILWHFSTQNFIYQCQLPNFICHRADLAHCGSSCCQKLWQQYREQEESPLCELQCCWCQSAWQQVAELLWCCSGKEQCEQHVRVSRARHGRAGTGSPSSRFQCGPRLSNSLYPSPVGEQAHCCSGAGLWNQLLPDLCWGTVVPWAAAWWVSGFWSAIDKLNSCFFFKSI